MVRRALLLAGLATSIFLPATSAASSATGLRGTVVVSPSRPVCVEGRPCTAPAPGIVLRFARNGRVVARTTTRADGTYRVLLRPARYAVSFSPNPGRRAIAPSTVRVPVGRVVLVDFEIDSGLQ